MNELELELEKWGATNVDVNYPRGARSERAEQELEDRRVILRYTRDGKETVLTMDKQKRAVDNLRVLYVCINALRMNERRGLGEVFRKAYMSLPEPVAQMDPYKVLKIHSDTDLPVAEAVFRTMAAKYHPDSKPDGDPEKFKEINAAIDMIRAEKGGKS